MDIPVEVVKGKIYLLRGQKVLLDADLAELYGVEAKVLNQAVRRNLSRFPQDFMFQLSEEEYAGWGSLRSQFVMYRTRFLGHKFVLCCQVSIQPVLAEILGAFEGVFFDLPLAVV